MASKEMSVGSVGGLSALFSRPKTEFVDKQGEDISISPQPTDLIYLRQCKQCTFRIHKKAVKCIIESCSDVKLELEDSLMSGTLEIIYSTSVTVSINPQDQLPTVSIERSSNIHLHYCKPTVFGSVFTVDCSDVSVHFQPPHKEEYQLELPSDPVSQYVSELKKTKMIISKVIREGSGYLVKKVELTPEQKALMRRKVEEFARQLFTFKTPESSTASKQTPESSTISKQTPEPSTTSEQTPEPSTTSEQTPESNTTSEQTTPTQASPQTEQQVAESSTTLADPNENP